MAKNASSDKNTRLIKINIFKIFTCSLKIFTHSLKIFNNPSKIFSHT